MKNEVGAPNNFVEMNTFSKSLGRGSQLHISLAANLIFIPQQKLGRSPGKRQWIFYGYGYQRGLFMK